jgi:3-hydroxyisobutyrate dehydrogenase-like beta-hydroxyacid dehydrogenase
MERLMSAIQRICLLGFGEVGQTLAADFRAAGITQLTAFDLLFKNPDSACSRAAATAGVHVASTAEEAVADADLIVSAVTAAQDLAAARSVTGALKPCAYFLDVNSVSPGVKTQAAELIDAAGARYVEAAIMSPISPKRVASPMLFGGKHAATFLPLAQQLGFAGAQMFSDQVGRASAAKMCRSVMIKGMEALLTESLLAARHYGVESTVLDSMRNLFPAADWSALARYMISRSLIHGRRRAEEMREVAQTVAEAGLQPHMSAASAQRQDWAAGYREAASIEELEAMLDAVLANAQVRDPAEKTSC